MTVHDLAFLFELRTTLQRQHGRVFLLVNAQDNEGVPPESRRYAAKYRSEQPFRGAVVVFGAGLIVRTAVTLILSASKLLGRSDSTVMRFATSETEAWDLIERERRALDGESPP